MRLVQETTDLPLCIDSSVVEALEAGLAAYEGKALVNSVTCEDERLERVLPLVKQHGAAIICLTNDETGIPATADERLEVCRRFGGHRPRAVGDPDGGHRHRPAGDDRRRRPAGRA